MIRPDVSVHGSGGKAIIVPIPVLIFQPSNPKPAPRSVRPASLALGWLLP